MGSAYFYLEFLMGWCDLLRTRQGFTNPAVFALEYTLVPTATYPKQLQETRKGYDFVLSKVKNADSDRVCVAGDSAGATLILSLLLFLAKDKQQEKKPGFATLISPWCELVSDENKDTPSDYLNAESLHLYARQYVGALPSSETDEKVASTIHDETSIVDPIASPGNCEDVGWWKRAEPKNGYHFVFGAEEVFAPNTKQLINVIKGAGGDATVSEKEGQIHAWPVVSLFLKDSTEDRLAGLYDMVDTMGKKLLH